MATSPFSKDVVFLYREFEKSQNGRSGVFYSRLDQIWEYKSASTLSFIIPKDRVSAEWYRNERWKVDIGQDVAAGFLSGENDGRGGKRKWS